MNQNDILKTEIFSMLMVKVNRNYHVLSKDGEGGISATFIACTVSFARVAQSVLSTCYV